MNIGGDLGGATPGDIAVALRGGAVAAALRGVLDQAEAFVGDKLGDRLYELLALTRRERDAAIVRRAWDEVALYRYAEMLIVQRQRKLGL